jgi:hypothetical protein
METRNQNGRDLFLFSNEELTSPATWPSVNPSHLPHFLLTLWWSENFLTKPHKGLGRAGPVCPFAGPSLERKTFWLTSLAGSEPDKNELEEIVLAYGEWFRELPSNTPEDAQYKTILILLPEVGSDKFASIIDATQKKLKPKFLHEQLMVGQFHPLSEEPGVQNAAFRPLQSPVPMLVIRQMTSGDIVFMKDEAGEYNPDFLSTYLKTFGKGLPSVLIRDIQGILTKPKPATAN